LTWGCFAGLTAIAAYRIGGEPLFFPNAGK
jgi:hypothetical protein